MSLVLYVSPRKQKFKSKNFLNIERECLKLHIQFIQIQTVTKKIPPKKKILVKYN